MHEIITAVLIIASFAIGYASPIAADAWLHRREAAQED
jgi:hypothetical protein